MVEQIGEVERSAEQADARYANGTVTTGRQELAAKKLAMAADSLVYDACRQVRRVKKHRPKVAIPNKPFA
jgi:hypothetical protein